MAEENGFAWREHEPPWNARGWLHGQTLEALTAINEQSLALLCEQAARCAVPTPALLSELRPLWCALDAEACRRAAQCPCLLVDAGFTDARRWGEDGAWRVHDHEYPLGERAFFSVPGSVDVLRQVLTFAWHLLHSQPAAARLLLGVAPRCAELIAALPLGRLLHLADTRHDWLRPRWCDRPQLWRQLLSAARSPEPGALEEIRLRGLPLLAGQLRAHGAG